MEYHLANWRFRAAPPHASTYPAVCLLLAALCQLCFSERAFALGGWIPVTQQPGENIGICLLLSDGTVLAEGSTSNWWKLTPDNSGNYANGRWTSRSSSTWGHVDGSTAVLQDGTVFVAGGEHGNGTNKVEIYNPVNDSWSTAIDPAWFGDILDGNAILLPNGQVLTHPQGPETGTTTNYHHKVTFVYDPAAKQFSKTAGDPVNGIAEATWVKLSNDKVLLIDSDDSSAGGTSAEEFDTSTGSWVGVASAGAVPNIWPDMTGTKAVSEMGPAFLLPNGNAIFFGGNGTTAIYTNGVFYQGMSIPLGLAMKDAPGAMLMDGHILLAVCPPGTNSDPNAVNGIGPTSFYEYDYTANGGAGGYTQTSNPGGGITSSAAGLRMLDLPDGTVLLSGLGTQLYVYQPHAPPLASGKPGLASVSFNADGSLHLTGTLFNGISQGANYGDDAQMDSNFPLVRFTDGSGQVSYGQTYNWSSTSVQTGSRIVTTECALPTSVSGNPGVYSFQVVANGIASDPVTFYSPVWVDFNYSKSASQLGTFANPYSTLGQGVTNVVTGGTICLKPGTSAETLSIAKAMTINAIGGTATVGQ